MHVHLDPRGYYAEAFTVAPPADLRASTVELPPLSLAGLLAED